MRAVTEVRHLGEYRLRLRFEDGVIKIVDMQPYLEGEVFTPLRDPAPFATVHVDSDSETIVWDNGADVAPEFLYTVGRELNSAHESLA